MIEIVVDTKDIQSIIDVNMSKKVKEIVVKTANFFETTAKEQLRKVVYKKSVPWTRTGKAQQSIVMRVKSNNEAQVYMGVNYGKFIEYGTKPHVIQGKPILSWKVGGQRFFARRVNHPGTKPRPFWRPTIKLTKGKIPEIVSSIWKN
jgi:HK97 gp10 family phage protein